jgi:hypothetical protein
LISAGEPVFARVGVTVSPTERSLSVPEAALFRVGTGTAVTGSEQAARRLHDGDLQDALAPLRSTFIEVRERYRKPTDAGARAYGEQAVQVDPTADEGGEDVPTGVGLRWWPSGESFRR